ncbi:pilus retraction ATPase PilT [Abditibacterium utsteinense]|uniref:Pilus retraction ATPase PilT n=1 Tax=Abditibacterium utsteinense TaxID=1960156 RepID=A0A2S8SVV8_9BACT|nr:type IV pilus twitching motility protein PilT [Abditibacterium utsteinense]PQV64929.1 pilus retraction ATPase PilT [Abditibacterium utsteinense]
MAQNPATIGRPVAPGTLPPRPQGLQGSNGLTPRPLGARPSQMPGEGDYAGNGAVEAPVEAPAPVEKVSLDEIHIDELLQHVLDTKGSDLHLAVGKAPCVRVHGNVKEISQYEVIRAPVIQRIIYDILSDEQIQRFENDLELDFAYTTADAGARFRVNAYRDKGSLAAAMRVIPTKIPNPEDLNLPPVIMEQANRPRGLMLVTGPTGSGKSTTLAAIINKINSEHEGHIITIEDPIEFVHPHRKCIVNQREVGTDTHSFKNALRASLREDPDVILVGEMRDTETIHLAVTAAETGHLVFGTLHTNSAAESIDRMVGVFPADQQEQVRTQLSNSLVAIVTQQLLPKIGGGRIGAIEIMIANSAIRNLIREAKAHQMTSIIQTQNGIGMQTMDQALRDLVLNGLVTYEDAMSRAHNPAELEVMIQGGMNG